MKSFILCCLLIVPAIAHHAKVGEYHLQQKNVCFGAKDNGYGVFTMKSTGVIIGIKLVHVSGKISCRAASWGSSNFGCGESQLSTLITNEKNRLLFPEKVDGAGNYKIDGFHSNSKEIILDNSLTNPYVQSGDRLRIWYGEDYKKYYEGDNHGSSCVHVYAMIRPVTFKLQARNVCFKAKGNNYGEFFTKTSGTLTDIKLVHKSGQVGCHRDRTTNFGCQANNYRDLLTLITLGSNEIIFPRDTRVYTLPQYDANSNEIILNNPKYNPEVKEGQALRIWYGEALKHYWDHDNPSGDNCVDVYANIRPSNYKLVAQETCIGAKGATYGKFSVQSKGILRSIKLEYIKGSVSCRGNGYQDQSHWGCGVSNEISILMTDTQDKVLIPHKGQYKHGTGRFKVPGYSTMSSELVLNYPNGMLKVHKGDKFRLWYGEDLFNYYEGDNGNQKVCARVYADIHEEYVPRCQGEDNGCCTAEKPCLVGEGDCDSNSECRGSYVCGTDNCPWGDNDDCCTYASFK